MVRKESGNPELEKAMRASLEAFASGDVRFFDYLQKDVRVYAVGSAEPFIGREVFQKNFESVLTEQKREVEVIASDLQVSDDQAILSQTLSITIGDIISHMRQTVIWEDGKEGWKMRHIHNALVGKAIAKGRMPANADDVRVLNERIAVVAATLGVAQ